eukprot:TRINITY_DN67580_c3_g1_i1.p1 TRINITY_DN67580_c3_g1~~TRINITY_DN67580_c3_g1_i1.p1  ORF type:complete len:117 (-),score=16.93 TRINITY_DN67580_c3_g1_i1:104-424(-)
MWNIADVGSLPCLQHTLTLDSGVLGVELPCRNHMVSLDAGGLIKVWMIDLDIALVGRIIFDTSNQPETFPTCSLHVVHSTDHHSSLIMAHSNTVIKWWEMRDNESE